VIGGESKDHGRVVAEGDDGGTINAADVANLRAVAGLVPERRSSTLSAYCTAASPPLKNLSSRDELTLGQVCRKAATVFRSKISGAGAVIW
jgi:hypothetical protein